MIAKFLINNMIYLIETAVANEYEGECDGKKGSANFEKTGYVLLFKFE